MLHFASGSEDTTMKLWNKNTGGLLRTLSAHGNWVWSVAFDSNDILASGSCDRSLKGGAIQFYQHFYNF